MCAKLYAPNVAYIIQIKMIKNKYKNLSINIHDKYVTR